MNKMNELIRGGRSYRHGELPASRQDEGSARMNRLIRRLPADGSKAIDSGFVAGAPLAGEEGGPPSSPAPADENPKEAA